MNEKQLQSDIKAVFKVLRLPAMLSAYQGISDKARKESLSYEEYLYNLLSEEEQSRENKRIARWMKESRLPLEKTMENFDKKRLPKKLEGQLSGLWEGGFVNRRENILAFGNPGSGKTHLLCAIATEMIYLGYTVLFKKCTYGSGTFSCKTRTKVTQILKTIIQIRLVDYRRYRLYTTEQRRNGGFEYLGNLS